MGSNRSDTRVALFLAIGLLVLVEMFALAVIVSRALIGLFS